MAALGSTMAQRCAQSNSFGADVHNCVHTNACNGKVMGTRLFCYAIPGKGYDACKAVFNELLSILENVSAIGAPVPGFMQALLKKLKVHTEDTAEENLPGEENSDE